MSSLQMPKLDRKTINKKKDIVRHLKKIIKSENVLEHIDELKPFETDGLSAYKQKPLIVAFPENTSEVSKILKSCSEHKIRVVPRGAGTGLSDDPRGRTRGRQAPCSAADRDRMGQGRRPAHRVGRQGDQFRQRRARH